MTYITVYSTLPNDVNLDIHETKGDKDKGSVTSSIVERVLIKGTNSRFRTTRVHLPDHVPVETSIDKDLWERVIKHRGMADQLLISGQIYTAKDSKDAKKKGEDAPKGVSSSLTKDTLNKKSDDKKII